MLLTTPPDAPRTAPLVSVIVPMLDAQDRVRYCVDSVLRQSFPHLEVLLADAGSSDDTPAILDEYARRDDRVSLVRTHASLINAARNTALDRASGEFVLFVDSAEILDRRAVELLLHALVRSDADMAKARWDAFDAADLYAVAELAAAGAREPESVTVTAEPLHAYGSVWRRCVRAAGDALHRDVEGRLFGESLTCRLYRAALWDGLRFPVDSPSHAAATARNAVLDAVRDTLFAADAASDHAASSHATPDHATPDTHPAPDHAAPVHDATPAGTTSAASPARADAMSSGATGSHSSDTGVTALRSALYARMRRMASIDVPLSYRLRS